MRGAEQHPGPLGDQRLSHGEPKAAAAAGHKVYPVPQAKIHAAILPRPAVSGSAAAAWFVA